MKYEELVKQVRRYAYQFDASDVKEHIAIQFNVYGEGEGALYLEIRDGRIDVQPYEYFDRDALVYVDAPTLLQILSKELSVQTAYQENRLVVQGMHDAVLVLDSLVLF